ncbi:hypothetical protein J4437_06285 [Candidatus Woesearchaeota archaeon]|nr:hypothetical protein [Candidatus Woesearchaeota archaeon]
MKNKNATEKAENQIRDLINWINVKQLEECEKSTTRIHKGTATVIVNKLRQLAKEVGKIDTK